MGEAVTISHNGTYQELREAEAGLAHALGLNPPAPSMVQALWFRPLLWLFGRGASVTVNREGIVTAQGSATRSFPWSDIAFTYETDGLICLVELQRSAPIYIPKRSTSPADLDAVRRLISENVIDTPEKRERVMALRFM